MMRQVMSDEEIRQEMEAFEKSLRSDLGVPRGEPTHFKRPVERPLLASERGATTILFGGFTRTHDYVCRAAAEGVGYKVQDLPVPDNAALALGKEFGNRGQCNPTYYTVGNLVKYLRELRDSGVENIERDYVFLTAGACGPCRFGMYEAEFRKALTEAGFPDFRVVLMHQTAGIGDGKVGNGEAAGIDLNVAFFAAVLRALISSDIVNTMAYRIRPYELEPGATDRALVEAREMLAQSFTQKRSVWMTLRRIRKMFDAIDVDFTRAKPRVKIMGEFWAQTTEGDGSYRMQSWLESEGAEVLTEPIGTWIDYILFGAFTRTRERIGLIEGGRKRLVMLWLGLRLYKSFYTFYRSAFSFRTEPLVSQKLLAEVAGDYYNVQIGGGEGHMEVGKHILSVKHGEAHMVTSIKPFGCMPSTQSDGVQSKVVADLKDSIFLPIETSGDGEANVKSRVQMKLFEAKTRARDELQTALDDHGVTLEAVREYARKHPELLRPMQKLPHKYVGTAPNFVAKVASRMPRSLRTAATVSAQS